MRMILETLKNFEKSKFTESTINLLKPIAKTCLLISLKTVLIVHNNFSDSD